MCDVALTHDETSMKLENATHILPGLAFDVILGFPCIRKKQPNHDFLLSLHREQLAGAQLH